MNGRIPLFLACLAFASPWLTAFAVLDDATTQRFPDADVAQEEIERVKYNPDGTSESESECWIKLLTEKGRRDESTQTIDYNRRYSKASFTYVGVIGTNGQERAVDVSGTTKESTDNSSMSSNIYDPLDRKLTCTIPGLKVGEVLHVKSNRNVFRARTERQWSDISVMEWTHPIVKSTYEVTAPAELPLAKVAVRNPLGNVTVSVKTNDDRSVVHTFVSVNSPQAFPEPDMPPLYTQLENIRVSTAKDWPEISRWYYDVCKPHLEKTNSAMTNKVSELKAQKGVDPIRSIFRFVSQEVRYMGLTMEDTAPGYAPHDVNITFDNRYGVCRDKAALLVAMLRIAGYKAYPVLIHVGAKLDKEIPQPFFNHAIVAVERETDGEPYMLMDPTNENTKDIFPAYLCNYNYIVARPEGDQLRLSKVPDPEKNALKVESKGKVSKDGSLFLENAIAFGGVNDTIYRQALAKRTNEERVALFERIVRKVVPGADLIKCEVEPEDMRNTEIPISVRISSKMPDVVLRGRDLDEMTVPFISRGLGMVNFLLEGSTSLEKRRFPLVLETTAKVKETVDIDFGGVLDKVLQMPDMRKIEGGYNYERCYSITGNHLKAERTLSVASVEFSPDEYLELREDIKSVEAAERKRPVFVRDRLANADIRHILEETSASVASDSEWVSTNAFVREVLTYDGKRKSAELKLPFHPAWQHLEIVSAVVSNRDGTVKHVSTNEINILDCGWASAAPRYPAGKIMVVNLPSVEIGSVISVTTAMTVTNSPAPYYREFCFDSTEPLDCRRVKVNDFQREVIDPLRLENEPCQAPAAIWRDVKTISLGNFKELDLKIGEVDPEVLGNALTNTSVLSIRNWMARYVKVVGPALYDLPLEMQLTDPEVVLKERYASRLDYIRTLCALLRGAGYDADVVLAANNAGVMAELRQKDMVEAPNVRAFSSALCRVTETEGGFLGIGGTDRVTFIGTENEYAPLGPSRFNDCDYFDPATCEFGVVTVPQETDQDARVETNQIIVRENGSVDMTIVVDTYGSQVGGFRKRFSEMLPEDRSRFYQNLLGGISQAATATAELITDVNRYPSILGFSCYIPDYAVATEDTISITLPTFDCNLPDLTGTSRHTPFAVGASDNSLDEVLITFPEGFTELEHLPGQFLFSNPYNDNEKWILNEIACEIKDDILQVKISRALFKRNPDCFNCDRFELLKDWYGLANGRSNRTIIVRRKRK